MLGMQVSAAESSGTEAAVKKNPTITKQITKESNIYAPKTTFKFTVAPGTAVPASENQKAIYAGPAKGVTLDNDVIASVPADSDIGNEKITVGTTKLNVNESVFTTGENAKPGQIYTLTGDLGVGKTVFTQGVAAGLGITEPICSPTFTIIQEYESGRIPLYHFDVYRIGDIEEMEEIGYDDYFFGQGICLIEWANLIEEILPDHYQKITIRKDLEKGFDYREIEMEEQ